MSASVSSWLVLADKPRKRLFLSARRRGLCTSHSSLSIVTHTRAPASALNFILWCGWIISARHLSDKHLPPPIQAAALASLPRFFRASLHIDLFLMKSLSD